MKEANREYINEIIQIIYDQLKAEGICEKKIISTIIYLALEFAKINNQLEKEIEVSFS